MSKTKRSFLQKLIGKNSNPTEEQNQTIDYRTNYENNFDPNQPQPPEAGPSPYGGNLPNNQAQSNPPYNDFNDPQAPMPPQNEMPSDFQEQADWNANEEGQLTIDVYQTENEIVIKSTIAGVKAENLDVQINNDMVTIKGERTQEEKVREEDYYYQECYWGTFSRSIILPVDVQASKAEANLKNGILTIRLPKSSSAQARKIQVRGF
jgi:HSP20 family protein